MPARLRRPQQRFATLAFGGLRERVNDERRLMWRAIVGWTPLTRYRLIGLCRTGRARAAFDGLGGGVKWFRWLLREAGADDPSPSEAAPSPRHVRDARIVELRRDGWMLAEIAADVGMTEGG